MYTNREYASFLCWLPDETRYNLSPSLNTAKLRAKSGITDFKSYSHVAIASQHNISPISVNAGGTMAVFQPKCTRKTQHHLAIDVWLVETDIVCGICHAPYAPHCIILNIFPHPYRMNEKLRSIPSQEQY